MDASKSVHGKLYIGTGGRGVYQGYIGTGLGQTQAKFEGFNTTTLPAGWSAGVGTWSTVAGTSSNRRLQVAALGSGQRATFVDTRNSCQDGIVEAEVQAVEGTTGVGARLGGINNQLGYFLVLRNFGGSPSWVIQKTYLDANNVLKTTALANGPLAYTVGNRYRLRLEFNGNQLAAFVGDDLSTPAVDVQDEGRNDYPYWRYLGSAVDSDASYDGSLRFGVVAAETTGPATFDDFRIVEE
jgi:hypothetical protein